MRNLSVITLLALFILPSGYAPASPPIAISAEGLQSLQTQAAQGNADAQNKLGKLYFRGQSVPLNNTTAREWFEKSAAQGNVNAQYNLGWMYAYGRGVPQDYVRAYMWWSLAAQSTSNAEESEESILDKVARRMTPAQIAEAQRLLQQCQARQFVGC